MTSLGNESKNTGLIDLRFSQRTGNPSLTEALGGVMIQNEIRNKIVLCRLDQNVPFTFSSVGTDNCILTQLHLVYEVFMRLMRIGFEPY